MKTSVVMHHPVSEPQTIKSGFSWGACLLGPLWAIYRRLWMVLILMIGAFIPIVALDEFGQAKKDQALLLFVLFLYLAYMIVCGAFGNRWRKWTLEKRGFVAETKA